jgi:guanylate kinase
MEEKLAVANVILDVEPNGAFAVRKHRPDATLIFIMPPSEEILEFRLRNRQNTSEEQIQIRLDRAKWEMAQRFEYDHVVVNDDLDTCVNEILKLITEKAD